MTSDRLCEVLSFSRVSAQKMAKLFAALEGIGDGLEKVASGLGDGIQKVLCNPCMSIFRKEMSGGCLLRVLLPPLSLSLQKIQTCMREGNEYWRRWFISIPSLFRTRFFWGEPRNAADPKISVYEPPTRRS